ncbi:MAG: hypothetical protein EBU90_13060 [Proteobacteria bacterium]|nr:hypothetical protein [Pseudomonadota bacterium]NBP15492.1 hypothetical protein [bacterium]
MNKIKYIMLFLAFTVSFGFADTLESNNDFDVADAFLATGDLAVVRPISSAATIGAFGIFAVVAPFTEMAGCTEETYEGLVGKTGKFSFDRDLGDFKK